jgi:hypothetical protein
MRVPIGKTLAAAIREDVAEINQVTQILQARMGSNARFTEALIRDAGFDPAAFGKYELIEEGGESFLVSTVAPKEKE